MKKRNNLSMSGASLLLGSLLLAGPATLSPAQAEQVTLKEGKTVVLEDGQARLLKETLELTPIIKVFTNGTFTVNQGKPRNLEEGQILDDQGMLTRPNGTVQPVVDHVTMKRGQVVLVRDGEEKVLRAELALPTGVRVQPNGVLALPNGRFQRLIDGQTFKLDGSPLPTLDTVTLRDGKVQVQKDGSQFTVGSGRFLVMNDGTKVYGQGKVVKPDGAVIQLTEGQILKLEGTVPPKSR